MGSMDQLVVRAATLDDAAPAVEALRDSITTVCATDHENDPATLDRWLANKTPGQFREWLENERNAVVVAERLDDIAGVGLIQRSGELRLCYVRAAQQRSGAGRAILDALEDQARAWGVVAIRLMSTISCCAT